METGRIRRKKRNFTQVSNAALRDPKLSLKAKGLFALINSYLDMENFTVYKSFLLSLCVEGKAAFQSTWDELKDHGYLVQYKLRDERGFYVYEYELVDNPEEEKKKSDSKAGKEENPYTENRDVDDPDTDYRGLDNPDVDNQDVEEYKENKTVQNNTESKNTSSNNTADVDDLNELEAICGSLLELPNAKQVSSLPRRYNCDKEMLYYAIGLAYKANANNPVAYIVSLFKDWNRNKIHDLSDLGASLMSASEAAELLNAYKDARSVQLKSNPAIEDHSKTVEHLSKVLTYVDLLDMIRDGEMEFNINYRIK